MKSLTFSKQKVYTKLRFLSFFLQRGNVSFSSYINSIKRLVNILINFALLAHNQLQISCSVLQYLFMSQEKSYWNSSENNYKCRQINFNDLDCECCQTSVSTLSLVCCKRHIWSIVLISTGKTEHSQRCIISVLLFTGDNTEGVHAAIDMVFIEEHSLNKILNIRHTRWLRTDFLSMAEHNDTSGEHYGYIWGTLWTMTWHQPAVTTD